MSKTRVNLILHAHSPYVRHLEYPKFLEENWFFEDLCESYIPLLKMLENLDGRDVPFRLSICFSPTLCTMLLDEPLQERFVEYMQGRIELGEKEVARTRRQQPECHDMAKFYLKSYKENLALYESMGRNILDGFIKLQEKGVIEIIATAATHCYFPLYKNYEAAVRAQIEIGVKSHIRFFHSAPKGFWLPECGYYPGLEDELASYGIRWCQIPAHSVITAKNKILSAGYQPVRLYDSEVIGFPRDWSITNLVWSDSTGYPCDPDYREFYRDIGYDLDMDYIRPYVHEPDVRVFTGYKYMSITGRDDNKLPYDLSKAADKVKLHADNFLYHLRRKAMSISAETQTSPVLNLCFDAELFGHRWFEGIAFLKQVLQNGVKEKDIEFTTPGEILSRTQEYERAELNECSWGRGGYSDSWLDGENSWVYRHVHKAIERMEELAERFPNQRSLKARFLDQAAREVLLAMASDWPYILHDKTSVIYAEKRLRNHLGSFNVVYSNMCKNSVHTEWLIKAEKRNAIFPEMDYNLFLEKKDDSKTR